MKVDIYKPEKRYKILYADPHTRSARVREKIRKLVGGGQLSSCSPEKKQPAGIAGVMKSERTKED